ncbi:MAG: MBL fold metallo-hydrolase [Bryobacteraceae bacterium]|nr:MBL fold metallo-hydrolase [Bryobacteraceae bacterium]
MHVLILLAWFFQASEPLETGRLPREWPTGGPRCMESPDFFIHEYNPHLFILRESGCSHYEKPFLYLIFGQERVMLLDTGAGKSELVPLVDRLIAQWSERHGRPKPKLMIAHTHSHSDHHARDAQFAGRAGVEFAGTLGLAPEGDGQVELGERTLDVFAMPGHDTAAIIYYDRRTGILFTGDNIYPGRLYIRDWAAYVRSTRRLVDFTATRRVSHLLGNHIEQTATPYVEFPVGTKYQPEEHGLELGRAHLLELQAELARLNGKPARVALRDFTLYPKAVK